jgi:hypothetical protein
MTEVQRDELREVVEELVDDGVGEEEMLDACREMYEVAVRAREAMRAGSDAEGADYSI